MAITILPATPDDAEDMIDVGNRAFGNDMLSNATFDRTSATAEECAEYKSWRVKLSKLRMSGPGKHYVKAVDETTGAIVGYAGLMGPKAERLPHSAVPLPAFINADFDQELTEKFKSTREQCLGERQDVWYVQSMLVDPDHQGRGIATRLLNEAMRGADEAGEDVYLEGTAAGQALYLRCGFQPLQDISFLDGTCIVKAMLRHPKPLEGH